MRDRPAQQDQPRHAQGEVRSGGSPDANAVQEYRALARDLQEGAPAETAHQLDREIAWIMAFYGGYTPAAIKQAMHEASLHLARHGGDAHTYVERTVEEAMQENVWKETALGWGA